MYGRCNVETLDKVIDTVNAFHSHQTELESEFEVVSFNFDLQMCMCLTEEGHANQYYLFELARKDFFRGIATLRQCRLPQELFPDTCLKSIVHKLQTMV